MSQHIIKFVAEEYDLTEVMKMISEEYGIAIRTPDGKKYNEVYENLREKLQTTLNKEKPKSEDSTITTESENGKRKIKRRYARYDSQTLDYVVNTLMAEHLAKIYDEQFKTDVVDPTKKQVKYISEHHDELAQAQLEYDLETQENNDPDEVAYENYVAECIKERKRDVLFAAILELVELNEPLLINDVGVSLMSDPLHHPNLEDNIALKRFEDKKNYYTVPLLQRIEAIEAQDRHYLEEMEALEERWALKYDELEKKYDELNDKHKSLLHEYNESKKEVDFNLNELNNEIEKYKKLNVQLTDFLQQKEEKKTDF